MRLCQVPPGEFFVFATSPGVPSEEARRPIRQSLFMTDRHGGLWVFFARGGKIGWHSLHPIEPLSANRQVVMVGLPGSLAQLLRECLRGPKILSEDDLVPQEAASAMA